jgi:hypothetical protein
MISVKMVEIDVPLKSKKDSSIYTLAVFIQTLFRLELLRPFHQYDTSQVCCSSKSLEALVNVIIMCSKLFTTLY